ncbi:MAG TPA: Sir2 family NAD-dependent protein deacetylase, partial [Bacteroidota bacterium]|nr:Sir2 family NAD-dependent protein deacetylase [Bacteroidota bacterium]
MVILLSSVLKTKLQRADSVAVFTGAGISAESGVPTFRGADGIWKKFKAEELANFDAFIRNPELVWEWYKHRKQIVASIQPNAGHTALAEMERRFPQFAIITQNIDNLHRR